MASVSGLFYSALHLVTGDAQGEAGAAAGLFFALHLAVMPPSDRADQCQAQADSAMPLAGAGEAIERLEDALSFRGRHTRPAVAHSHHRIVAFSSQFH